MYDAIGAKLLPLSSSSSLPSLMSLLLNITAAGASATCNSATRLDLQLSIRLRVASYQAKDIAVYLVYALFLACVNI